MDSGEGEAPQNKNNAVESAVAKALKMKLQSEVARRHKIEKDISEVRERDNVGNFFKKCFLPFLISFAEFRCFFSVQIPFL